MEIIKVRDYEEEVLNLPARYRAAYLARMSKVEVQDFNLYYSSIAHEFLDDRVRNVYLMGATSVFNMVRCIKCEYKTVLSIEPVGNDIVLSPLENRHISASAMDILSRAMENNENLMAEKKFGEDEAAVILGYKSRDGEKVHLQWEVNRIPYVYETLDWSLLKDIKFIPRKTPVILPPYTEFKVTRLSGSGLIDFVGVYITIAQNLWKLS